MRSLIKNSRLSWLLRCKQNKSASTAETGNMAAKSHENVTRRFLDSLSAAQIEGRAVTLRDVHHLVGLPQPVALRLIDDLRLRGLVAVEHEEYDAFGARVTLAEPPIQG